MMDIIRQKFGDEVADAFDRKEPWATCFVNAACRDLDASIRYNIASHRLTYDTDGPRSADVIAFRPRRKAA